MSVQLRGEPALACPFNDLQGFVQLGHRISGLPGDLICLRQEGERIGHHMLRPGGAVCGRAATQETQSLRHIVSFDLYPAAKDRSKGMPAGETLLGRYREELISPLMQGCVVSNK